MACFIVNFSVDPAPGVVEFLASLNRLIAGPELQVLEAVDGVKTSMVHQTDGQLDVILERFTEDRHTHQQGWETPEADSGRTHPLCDFGGIYRQ